MLSKKTLSNNMLSKNMLSKNMLSKNMLYITILSENNSTNHNNNDNILLEIICGLIIIILICIAISHYAFKNGLLTCDHYVLNTYLYILLSIFIIYLMVLINDKTQIFTSIFTSIVYNILNTFGLFGLLIVILIYLFLIYILYNIPPDDIITSNFIWLLIIVVSGIFIIPLIKYSRELNVLNNAWIYTCIIVIITGLLGYYKGDYIIRFDWDYYLYISLIALFIIIIIGILCIIVYKPKLGILINFIYIINIISLIIFILLLLSVHKQLKENAEKCINGKGTIIPNYPTQSFTIIIKIYNIFANLIHILGIKKIINILK